MKQNITLDFTTSNAVTSQLDQQELAIMPAILAKKLLKDYAQGLISCSPRDIILPLIDDLQSIINGSYEAGSNKVNQAITLCADFIQERGLITACSNEEWDKFAVKSEEPAIVGFVENRSINEL